MVADALTSQTAQTTANPDGSYTLRQAAEPVRVRRNGGWVNLDATLVRNPGGSLSPAESAASLVLSGGGTGPLAVMTNGGRQFALTLPVRLPAPRVSGAEARYPEVLPGVDLVVTVDAQGGFRDVLVVKTPAAARSPVLGTLLTASTAVSGGMGVRADAAGGLSVTDHAGRTVFAAPPPRAWDSAGRVSTVDGPGAGAHTTRMAVAATAHGVRFSPPAALLAAPGAAFPVYLDPWYSPSYSNSGWATFGSGYPGDPHWDSTTDPTAGINQIGYTSSGVGVALTLFDFPVPSSLKGATITGATFGIYETYSYTCPTSSHDLKVDLSAPSDTLTSSNATYGYWSGRLGSNLTSSHSFAHGYNSSCPAAAESFGVADTVIGDVGAGKTTQTFALHADDSSDPYAFKEFQASSASLTITYDHPPATPGKLATSPATSCSGSTVGDGSIALYATPTDADGGQLTTTYTMWKSTDTAQTNLLTRANNVASNQVVSSSGLASMLTVPESLLKSQAAGVATGFTWSVVTSDGTLPSTGAASCSFTFDPTRPGPPGVAPTKSPAVGKTCATVGDSGDPVQPVGTLCSFTITPNASGSAPAGYAYQLNEAAPVTVPGSALTSTGVAVITLVLPRLVNTLTVVALSSGGNAGPPYPVYVNGTSPDQPAVDGDLTHDGAPDLIVPGGTGTVPSGLWLAAGNRDGSTALAAVNIGTEGTGRASSITPASATEWNGTRASTGDYCGNGMQDVLAYYPSGASAGGGAVLCGDGSDAPLHLSDPVSGGQYTVTIGTFTDAPGTNTGNPAVELANAGNTSGNGTGIPDQLAVIGNYLWLYSSATPTYSPVLGLELTKTPSPDGFYDWSSWTIATAQDTRNGSTVTDMYLWQASTGTLVLWTALGVSTDGATLTTGGTYPLATGWHTSPADTLVLRAADLNGDGRPDLFVTDTTTATTTAYLLPALANNPTLGTVTTGLAMPAGSWPLNSTVDTTAPDAGGTHPVTLAGGAKWAADTVRGAVLSLDGSSGYAATGTGVLDATRAYTVSAWLDLAQNSTTADYVAVSQDGTNQSGFALGYSHSTNSWWFNKPCSDTTGSASSAVWQTASEAPTRVNTWTNLTAQFDPASGAMRLYVNGVLVAKATDTCAATSFAANGPLAIGRARYNAASVDFFPGQISDVEVFQSLASPAWIATHGAPAPAHRWSLSDGTGTTAADSRGDSATLSAGAGWATDAARGAVLSLNGTTGYVATSSPALSPNADFTVSAWVKPATADAGVAFSQDGTKDSSILVYPTSASGWIIGMNTGGTTTWSFNGANGGSVQAGVWSQLTLTYTAVTGVLTLYVNGLPAVTLTDTAPPAVTGAFVLGADKNGGARSAYFAGQISDVRVWDTVVPPFQPAMLSGTVKLFQSEATGLCLDGNSAGSMYGSTCQTGNVYQTWFMALDANGFYRLQSQGTARCLDGNAAGSVYSSSCDTTNGYQHWYLWWDGTYYQLKSLATGRCLDGNSAGSIYSNTCAEPGNTNGYQHWK
ncbi:MAG TPA: LamG-like jellyroll fold domain-containing protein [Rugosimonospora sp.]|nr:LamG-like jellyroll fold domain-containing protein [Rugosimonospora sp.]